MTIITKPCSDKKLDKLEEPLVASGDSESKCAAKDVEVGVPTAHLVFPAQARRVNTATTLCAFVTALLFVAVGIIGGVYLYQQMARVQPQRYYGTCIVPVTSSDDYDAIPMNKQQRLSMGSNYQAPEMLYSSNDKSTVVYLKEEVEVDSENGRYERIRVPSFNNGRRGLFIHDFSANKTGIVDLDGNRCFVMPLNRSQTLPPKSFIDILIKMQNGYYDVNTDMVRETMRIVFPPTQDYKAVGYFIALECESYPIYMLEAVKPSKYLSKRSAEDDNDLVFNLFSGKDVLHLHIVGNHLEH